MYRGFNLNLSDHEPGRTFVASDFNLGIFEEFSDINNLTNEIWGRTLFDQHKKIIIEELSKYVSETGVIDGSKLQDQWFPSIEADIFISHSHGDFKQVLSLAGFLFRKFRIKCFIDSCIWGDYRDLLRTIDNANCFNSQNNTYDYDLRNQTTSHMHTMLLMALNKMIDRTECFMFIHSENSIVNKKQTFVKDEREQTYSPWIYGELEIARTIRKIQPIRFATESFKEGGKIKFMSESAEAFQMTHDVDTSDLVKITYSDLMFWIANKETHSSPEKALDKLYKLHPLD